MANFAEISLTGGGKGRAIISNKGQRLLQGYGGQFISAASAGLMQKDLDAIFAQLQQNVSALGRNYKYTPETVTIGSTTVTFSGLNQVLYRINYIDALLNVFPKVKLEIQNLMQRYAFKVLTDFVTQTLRPQAELIIDKLVYQPAMMRTEARMSLMASRRKRGRSRSDEELFDIELMTRVVRYNKTKDPDTGTYSLHKTRLSDIVYEQTGSGAATWGERRRLQREARIGRRVEQIGTRSGGQFEYNSFAPVSLLRSRSFMSYAGPRGILRQAFLAGIQVVSGTSIQIGIDESVFPPKKYGQVYWQFVEGGHRYVIPTGRGNTRVLPFEEPAKPFLQTLNTWMMNEGRLKLEAQMKEMLDLFSGAFRTKLTELFASTELTVRPMQGEMAGAYLALPTYRYQSWRKEQLLGLQQLRAPKLEWDVSLEDLMSGDTNVGNRR